MVRNHDCFSLSQLLFCFCMMDTFHIFVDASFVLVCIYVPIGFGAFGCLAFGGA